MRPSGCLRLLHFVETMAGARARRWSTDLSVRTTYVPWEQHTDWPQAVKNVTQTVASLADSPYVEEFRRRQLALLTFDANRMEGTIGDHHKEGPTMRRILEFIDGGSIPPDAEWNAEGGREDEVKSTDRQLYQFTKAVQFLLVDNRDAPLSRELILRTHQIMMENSFTSDGRGSSVKTSAGYMRSDPADDVCAGWHQFLPSRAVDGAVDALVEEYNAKAATGVTHPIGLATFLFYELITIHPFGNGNGRLCRLMLNWSLMRDALPFSISFSSGHSSRRQHYLHAIKRARVPVDGHRGELNVICLVSLQAVLGNFLENVRMLQSAESRASAGVDCC